MDKQFLSDCKQIIKVGNLPYLIQMYQGFIEYKRENEIEYGHNQEYIFKELFTHACYCNQLEIAQELYVRLFVTLETSQQYAIRHLFNYCHHITKTKKFKPLATWIQQVITQLRGELTTK